MMKVKPTGPTTTPVLEREFAQKGDSGAALVEGEKDPISIEEAMRMEEGAARKVNGSYGMP